MRPYLSRISKGLGLSLVIGSLGLISPILTKFLFDEVYPARDVSFLHVVIIGMVSLTVASSLMGALRTYYSQVISTRLSSALGLLFLNRLQHLPMRFFEQHRVGEIISRFGDVRAALGSATRVFETVLVNGVYIVLVPPMLVILNWRLALISIVAIPLTTAISLAIGPTQRRFWKLSAESSAEFAAFQVETLSQIRTFKSHALEHHVFHTAKAHAEAVIQVQLRATAFAARWAVVNGTLRTVGTALFTLYAWTLILRAELTLGAFIAFSAYLGYLTGPVSRFAGLVGGFQQSTVTLARMFEYLDEPVEQEPSAAYGSRAPITEKLAGPIVFDNVSFSYTGDRPVLRSVTLELEPRSITAMVGTSGVGKSSLLRLVCRLVEPDTGLISVNGKALRLFPLSDLRRQVGVVWQDVALLQGTLWDNLTLGLENPDPEIVEEAVNTCLLTNLVHDLPEGYDTPVAEWGSTLSGGQQQRIALARTLIRQTPILLLDEATSQLDPETESAVLHELLSRSRDKLVVLVSHRMSVAALADRICVLDAGRVVGIGSHSELQANCDEYARVMRASKATEDRHLRVV